MNPQYMSAKHITQLVSAGLLAITVQSAAQQTRPNILFCIADDKDCIINLSENPLYSMQKNEMKERLFSLLRQQGDPRMFGNGDVFDHYPFDKDSSWNFWERVQSGEITEPWKQTNWVNPSDYETYKNK